MGMGRVGGKLQQISARVVACFTYKELVQIDFRMWKLHPVDK